jgi:hypothetical protein
MSALKPFLNSHYWGPNWEEVVKAHQVPSDRIVSLSQAKADPLTRFDTENFGLQREQHIGGVPGRIGGCPARVLYALRGERSGQLLTWKGHYVFVHDQRDELEYLVQGQLHAEILPHGFPREDTVWIKDHPDFQSVCWPLDHTEFQDGRK